MKPKDLRKMFEAEIDIKITDQHYLMHYVAWLVDFACKVCDNLDIAESVMYPFPKGDK